MEFYNQNQELGDPGKMPISLLIIFILSVALMVFAIWVVVAKNSKKPVAKRIPSYAVPAAYAALMLTIPLSMVCLLTILFPSWWQG
jgi:flagellar basal body-associated protein FliL